MTGENKKRLFKVELDGDSPEAILKRQAEEIITSVETKLESKVNSLKEGSKVELEAQVKAQVEAVKVDLETDFAEKLNAHKQEIIELQKASNSSAPSMSKVEEIQLQRFNSCKKDGDKPVTLEDLRTYNDTITSQVKSAVNGADVKLDATIAGFAGYEDAKGGALVVPEVDPTIRQDFIEHDMGLYNAINFEPAMSKMKKVIVDLIEPDANTKATKEALEAIGYELDEGGFVTATVTLKDFDTPARLTYDMIEDSSFRIEPYVNGKLVQGNELKIAKSLIIGNSAQDIKGLISYPQGDKYGQVGVTHVATGGTVTMSDIMKLCQDNKNKGVLFIDKATWGNAMTEVDDNGRYKFELGNVAAGKGVQPFKFDAIVPFLNVPVLFDDGFTLPQAVAANVAAAILPPSAFVGIKRPVGRLSVVNGLKSRDLNLTQRADAVLSQFKYVRLLLNTAS